MSRPLHRGASGAKIQDTKYSSRDTHIAKISTDNQSKIHFPHDNATISLRYFTSLILPKNPKSKSNSADNCFGSDSPSSKTCKARHHFMLAVLAMLKYSLLMVVILALVCSVWWTVSVPRHPKGNIFRGYRKLQEQLITDLRDVGVLSLGLAKIKEADFCSQEYENYVPCHNTSQVEDFEGSQTVDLERHCHHGSLQNCLLAPPRNYRVPLRWPMGRDVIWIANVKITAQEVLASGSLTKRMMLLEEDQVSFRSDSLMVDGIEDYSHQIAEMIGLRNESSFVESGIRTVLDIGCGYGSFGAHLFSKQLLTMCIANYEVSGSQVQLTLERGLPAMVGSFTSKRLPFPSLSFDMLHCARCGVDWEQKDGMYLVELDRVLRPGGYFILTSPMTNPQRLLRDKKNQKKWAFIREFLTTLCWEMLSQQDETVVWQKTSKKDCYTSRKSGIGICKQGHDLETPYYQPLELCISGTQGNRWHPMQQRTTWPSRARLNATELKIYDLYPDEFVEDTLSWESILHNYWSLLSPLIFSDHPKRPGDEDPSPPFNMLRNVMDMNSRYGGLNAAMLDAGKTVWVMNVVPTAAPNHLPLILDRGFIGVLHDWCEAFPTYPRTYDMLHAKGLLSLEFGQQQRCSMLNLFLEMDRILRPEGWVILMDTAPIIEPARALAAQMRWDTRMVEIDGNSGEMLLICQKPLIRKMQK